MLAAAAVLVGCDTLMVGKVDAAMFPPTAAASAPPLAGRAALEMPAGVRGRMVAGPELCATGRKKLQVPLGDIVDVALQRQLGRAFGGGVVQAALPLPADSEAAIALSVTEMRLVFESKLNWMVPIPAPLPMLFMPVASSTNYSARVELDLRLTDALGRLLVQTTVDSGTVRVERGMWTTETPDQRCLKLTHEAAWIAAERAAKVLGETLQTERQRERAL